MQVKAHQLHPPMIQYQQLHSETSAALPEHAIVYEARPGSWNAGKSRFVQPAALKGYAILNLTSTSRDSVVGQVRAAVHSSLLEPVLPAEAWYRAHAGARV